MKSCTLRKINPLLRCDLHIQIDKTKPFEWQEDPKVLRKIAMIGGHDESNLDSSSEETDEGDGPLNVSNS